MKNLFFTLFTLSTFLVSNTMYSNREEFLSYFKSEDFSQMTKNHLFAIENVALDNYAEIESKNKQYKIYRTVVTFNDKINYLTFFTNDGGASFVAIFEKNNIDAGVFEHYDSSGFKHAVFTAKFINTKQILFKILSTYENSDSDKNSKKACIPAIYKILKDACSQDANCDFLCDVSPSCSIMLGAWAAAYCATH